jgi:hypothetical protein
MPLFSPYVQTVMATVNGREVETPFLSIFIELGTTCLPWSNIVTSGRVMYARLNFICNWIKIL